jgi:hypothetical protein
MLELNMGRSLGADKVLLFTIFVSLSVVYQDFFGDLPYVIAAIGYGITCVLVIFDRSPVLMNSQISAKSDYPAFRWSHGWNSWIFSSLWFFILLSWLIGAIVGAIYGNLAGNIFRNFFGLLLYITYPLLKITKPRFKSVYGTILAAALVQICFALYNTNFNDFDYYALAAAGSISDFRSSYSTGYVAIFPLFYLSLTFTASPSLLKRSNFPLKRLIANKIFLIVTAVCLVITPLSKGFIASCLLYSLFAAIVAFVQGKRGGYSRTVIILVCAIVALPIYYYIPSDVIDLLTLSFSGKETGNSIRLDQYDYLVAELAWFGKGLGATLASGYSREENGYGFELIYVNLIHKLGIFVVPLFFSYLVTVFLALKDLLGKFLNESTVVALGLMGYLVVGVGNPILLSTSSVLLHCLAMYLLAHTDTVFKPTQDKIIKFSIFERSKEKSFIA